MIYQKSLLSCLVVFALQGKLFLMNKPKFRNSYHEITHPSQKKKKKTEIEGGRCHITCFELESYHL